MHSALHGLGELIAYLPYELGFRPTDSLVVVGLQDRHIQVVARLDLGEEQFLRPGIARTGDVFARAGVRTVLCCAFVEPDPAPASGAIRLLDLARAQLASDGIEASHLLMARENMWWAHRCCCGQCPAVPTAVPDPDRVDAVFESVLHGVAPHASRAELRASLSTSHRGLARAIAAAPVTDAAIEPTAVIAAMWEILHGTMAVREMPVPVLAGLSRAVADPVVRDEIFGWVAPGLAAAVTGARAEDADGMGGFDPPAVRARLVQWLHCLPDPARPPVLTFIAGSAWSSGSGALASVAVELALQIDPGYRLAQLLGRAVEYGVRPGRCA